jgi:hypothetical protein
MKNLKFNYLLWKAAILFISGLTVTYGCASSGELRNCQQRIDQMEKEKMELRKQIEDHQLTTNQLTQQVTNLKFDLDLLRKQVLSYDTPSTTELSQEDPEGEISKILNQLRAESYELTPLVKQITALGNPALRACLGLLKDPDFKIRTRAELVFTKLPAEQITPILLEASKNPELRVSVVHILGNIQDTSTIPLLIEYLKNAPPELDLAIGEALVKLKDKRGLPRLIEYLKSEDTVQRAIAFECLTKATNLSFDYKLYAPPVERIKAISSWENWWLKQGADFQFK